MKTLIVYYSRTGNNEALASEVATRIDAELFRLETVQPRTNGTIAFDQIFGRAPALSACPDHVDTYDLVLFMSPVWMFRVASPLRRCLKQLRPQLRRYALVTMSGGALGPNCKVAAEAVKYAGNGLVFDIDLRAAQWCTVPENPTTDDTSAYTLADHPEDLSRLAGVVEDLVSHTRVQAQPEICESPCN